MSCFIADLRLALFRSFSQTSGERNVVEIHTTDFSDKEQRHPVASLTLGQKDFANVDLCLTFSKTKEVKFILQSEYEAKTMRHSERYSQIDSVDDGAEVAEEFSTSVVTS